MYVMVDDPSSTHYSDDPMLKTYFYKHLGLISDVSVIKVH